jgi:hypothetical protein
MQSVILRQCQLLKNQHVLNQLFAANTEFLINQQILHDYVILAATCSEQFLLIANIGFLDNWLMTVISSLILTTISINLGRNLKHYS